MHNKRYKTLGIKWLFERSAPHQVRCNLTGKSPAIPNDFIPPTVTTHLRKYLDIILINLIAMLLGIGLFYLSNEKVEVLGAVIATGISLSLGIRQYKTENDKLFKELFTEFNTKYDLKFNNTLEEIVKNSELDKNYQLSSENEKLIVDYLNFCAEEYLWTTKERIPKSVWKSWENGMLYYLNNPIINKVVNQQKGQKDSYYGLFQKIEKRLNTINN